jgi:two-component system cell cycle sensor histidine kinase/response regulator CckA
MYRMFGKPPGYVPTYGGFLTDLTPVDRQRMERLIADSLERKTGNSIEYQIVLPQGDVRTIFCIWEVLLDEEGTPVRLFGTCQDITDSRRTQEESFERQKLESVGTLASGIAHDFNNLLGGVLIQADLGLAECDAGEFPHQELVGIRNVAIRGSEIVRQLMIYAGRESAEVGIVDVSRIVEEMLELLKVSVSKRAVLEADLGRHLPPIHANAAQIRQIVMNLVTNASDAIGDRDGVIRVATRAVAEEDHLELEVSDTGPGMTAATQAKMFDPFFTTKSAGHGLGLSVVHGIVRGIGGSILFNSELERGTTFQILLPVAKQQAGPATHTLGADEVATSGFREATILVVEDEDLLREAIAKMLRKAGFEAYEAADGSAAIELLRARGAQIDLILLDLTIPGASGAEVVTQAVKVRPDVRVVLTSAYGREMIGGSLKSPQVRDFIRKPFRIEDLVSILRKTLAAAE